MLNLIQNENMKIYRRLRTWIIVGILLVVAVLGSIIFKADSNSDWRQQAERNIESGQRGLNEPMPTAAKNLIKDTIAIDQYRLDHNIPPATTTPWGAVMKYSVLIVMITFLTVIIAGDSVAGEFSSGTIKLLLIRPASRSKILLSKYLACFLFALFLLLILFLSTLITNSLIFGFTDFNLPYLHMGSTGEVVESNMVLQVLKTYGLACVSLIMIVTIAFMISSVFRSSALSIALSLVLLFLGPNLTFLLAKYEWVKYVLFANIDLSQYTSGSPLIEGMTLQFSIIVLLVYFIIFNALSWFIFNKRDVAA